MRMSVVIRIEGEHYSDSVGYQLDELMTRQLEPIRSTDLSGILFPGEVQRGTQQYQEVLKLREDTVNHLARQMAEGMLGALAKKDTRNGYTGEH